jgi:hypothetical protein
MSKRDNGGKFLPGNPGKPAGARNRLQASFVDAMQKEFDAHGADIIKIVRTEKPTEFLKILAGILPKEMLLTGDVVEDLSDDELKDAIAALRKLKGADAAKAKH